MGKGFINKTHPFSNYPQKLYFDREFRGVYFDDTGELLVVIPAGVPATLATSTVGLVHNQIMILQLRIAMIIYFIESAVVNEVSYHIGFKEIMRKTKLDLANIV